MSGSASPTMRNVAVTGRSSHMEGPAESGMMGVMHERPEDSAPAPQPAPKSSYELPNRKNTSLRNILWALGLTMAIVVVVGISFFGAGASPNRRRDRKSTRLNSSHVAISYAVFCLKKKKIKLQEDTIMRA